MAYSTVLFDVDGTILDTKKASLLATQAALEQTSGQHFEIEDLEDTFGRATVITGTMFGYDDPNVYVEAVDRLYAEYGVLYNCVFPGIEETLVKMQNAGVALGVVTAKTRWEYDHDFSIFDLGGYFPCTITASDTKRPKPAADHIDKYVEWTGVDKNQILFVGDTFVDHECAQNAGVAFAFAVWSGNAILAGADYYPETPIDLLQLI